MSTLAVAQAIFTGLSLVVGIAGGFIGAYVGMRVGVAKLETWRDLTSPKLDDLANKVTLHDEDLNVFDMEIGTLMEKAGVRRVRRQRMRD
ncbi:MAG TPA: hypothetical protein VFX20_18185 [Steroidobacteraceae bacterium]|nr:hypothetical protein [Steroidobacteraceae bacterium]